MSYLKDVLYILVATFFGTRAVGRAHDAWVDSEWNGAAAFMVFASIVMIAACVYLINVALDSIIDRVKR